MRNRITLALVALFGGLLPMGPTLAQETSYPTRPITLVIGWAAGGGTDTIGRLFAEELSEELGQNVVVDNRPGAGSTIATQYVVDAEPDGYTLLFGTQATTGSGPATQDVPYDPFSDLTPIAYFMVQPNVFLVHESLGVSTLEEFVELAQERSDLTFGSAGVGALSHLAAEYLFSEAGVQLTHVPYSGGANALTALRQGEIDVLMNSVIGALPALDSGSVVIPLGLTGSSELEVLPDVPPISQTIPGYNMGAWEGLFGPAGMADELVDRLYEAVTNIADSEAAVEIGRKVAGTPSVMTREEFVEFLRQDAAMWQRVVEIAGIMPQ